MKPIFRFLSLFSALLLVATNGCLDLDFQLLSFVNPSVAPEEAKVQTELFGTYIVTEPTELDEKASDSNTWFAHLGRAGEGFPDGFLKCVSVNHDRKGEMSVDDSELPYFASKVEDCYILNMPWEKNEGKAKKDEPKGEQEKPDEEFSFDDEAQKPKATKWIPENYGGYCLVLFKPTETGFAMHMLNEDFIRSEIAAGRLNGEFITEDQQKENRKKRKAAEREGKVADDTSTPFLVHARSKELQAFFKKNLKEVTGDVLLTFKRVE